MPSSSSSSSSLPLFLSLFLSLSLLLFFLPSPSSAAGSCQNYTLSFCAAVINYPVYVPQGFSQELLELNMFSLGIENLTLIGSKVDPVCADAGRIYACARAYPRCGEGPVPLPSCRSVSFNFDKYCSLLLNATGNPMTIDIPEEDPADCTSYYLNEEIPADFACPAPLIRNPNSSALNLNCAGECCVPCPQTHYFYPEGVVNRIDQGVLSVSFISWICSILVILSYSLMPEKRSYPSNIILFLGIALFIIYFPSLLLLGDPSRVRCNDPVTQALPGNNENAMCRFQSTMLIYGFLALVFWFCLLVVNIYVSVIFLSKRMQDFWIYIMPVGWLLPIAFVIAAHVWDKTGYAFGISCVLETGEAMTALLLGPIAAMLFPAVLLNVHVLIKIFMVARRRNASLQAILRLQLRSFFFVTTMLIIFLFYWIFIEVNVNPLILDPTAPWVHDWFFCIAQENGQTACAALAADHVPLLIPFTLAEILVYSVGIIIFGFFVIKDDIFYFWRALLTGNTRRIFEKSMTTSMMEATQRSTHKSQQKSAGGKGTVDEEMDEKSTSVSKKEVEMS